MFTLNNGWKHCLLASIQDRHQLCLQSYCYNKIRKERISKIPLLHNFLYNLKKLGNHMPFRKEKERTSKDNSSNYSNSQGMKRFIFAYWLWFLQQWWRHICYAACIISDSIWTWQHSIFQKLRVQYACIHIIFLLFHWQGNYFCS